MNGIAEKLIELEAKREEKTKRMTELTTQCDSDFKKLPEDEQREFDTLVAELGPLDRDITRYQGVQRAASSAKPVDPGFDPERSTRVRNGDFNPKSNLPKGTAFVRATLIKAKAIKSHSSMADAAEYARKMWPDTPEVALYLKANPGTGLSGNWAEPLNVINTVEGDFIDLLRPATVLGRLNLRPAPFNVKMIRQTSGSTVNWVGRAAAKPVGEMAFDTVTVPQSKIAGIIVLTDDQIMSSHIDSVEATRRDMVAQVAQFADEQFLDPAVGAVADVNPASVTNGVTPVTSNGATAADVRADIFALLNKFAAARIPLGGVSLVMSSFVASGISMLTNAFGQPEFPTLNVDGGTLRGLRVVISDNIPGDSTSSIIVAIKEDSVLLAQSGGIKVDMSREATIDMAGGNTPAYSLWQKNSVGLRTEWWVSWVKARDEAVQYVNGAAYAPQPA
jgi:HK97 family phage major capsid protein